MKIIMLRHFATRGNVQKRYIGRTDEPIIEDLSWKTLITSLRENSFLKEVNAVYISPMIRCIQTSGCLFPGIDPMMVFDFRECDFGEFEYKNYDELKMESSYQEWLSSNGALPFPGGESREQFQKRCSAAFDKIIIRAIEEKYNTIALVIHGGTIMSILDSFSEPHKNYYEWQIGNGQGLVMDYKENGRLCHICMLQ